MSAWPTVGAARLAEHRLGVNAYYLVTETARRLSAGEDPLRVAEEVFDAARAAGATVVRALAYSVGETEADLVGRAGPRRLGLEAIGLVLDAAARAGVALVLALGNHWDDYGGARAMVSLAGRAHAVEGDVRFYVHPDAVALHRAVVRAVLGHPSRAGTVARHPALLGLEPLNEPRAPLDRTGLAVAGWLDRALGELGRHAPGVLRSSGGEGLDSTLEGRDRAFWKRARALHLFRHGRDFARESQSADVASVHVYPDAWHVPEALWAEAGERFLREAARRSSRPLFVGEMGAVGPRRLELLARWAHVTRALGGLPVLWMLAVPSAKGLSDRYAIDARELAALTR